MSWQDSSWRTWWTLNHLSYAEQRRLTCQACETSFRNEKEKQRHVDKVHGYTHGTGQRKEDLRCPHCQEYVPSKDVLNPRGCLRNHMRRSHGDYAKPYIIEEQPF